MTFPTGILPPPPPPSSHAQELRNEKAKEAAPFHTIDYRSTDVRELPHKMRALFEDNQASRQACLGLHTYIRSICGWHLRGMEVLAWFARTGITAHQLLPALHNDLSVCAHCA